MNTEHLGRDLFYIARAAVVVCLWLGLLLAVFFGVYTVPILLMTGLCLLYLLFSLVRRKRAERRGD